MNSKETGINKFGNKILVIALTGIFIFSFLSCAKNSYPAEIKNNSNWIPFAWIGIKSGERYFEKAAMSVPFRLEGVSAQFKSQFDLGATHTMVYGNSFQPYLDLYKDNLVLTDTSAYALWLQSKKRPFFKDARVFLGEIPFTSPKLAFFDNFGTSLTADSLNSQVIRKIGTVGADLFKDKILVIDYPNQRMKVLDSLSRKRESAFNFVTARFEGGRIKIPFIIQNIEHWLMFDTGSSLFPISTSPKYYDQFADKSIIDSIETTSWGKKYWVYGSPLADDVKLGSTTLPKLFIYSFPNFTEFFESEKIMGITGNAFFLNSVIAIDS